MLRNITYRIVTDEDAETVTFQLKSGQEFPLNRLFMPVVAEDQKVCFHLLVDVETLLRVDVGPVSLNGLKIGEDPVLLRPGDVLRLNGHSIEIQDCPTPKKDQLDTTKFIDSSVLIGQSTPKLSRKLPIIAALTVTVCFSSMFATAPSTVNSDTASRKFASDSATVVDQLPAPSVTAITPAPAPVVAVIDSAKVAAPTTSAVEKMAEPPGNNATPIETARKEPVKVKTNGGIFQAISENNLSKVKSLLKSGVSPDFTLDEHGRTPLLAAASLGRLKIIQFLVSKKVNLEVSDFEGKTALMLAVSGNNLETVKYLLAVRVDTTKKSEDGETALSIAKAGKNAKILAALKAVTKGHRPASR